ncbi:hypothetical protein PR048_033148 [Dryococelus australis]|uniref:Uncharacterized protein n=1 Tax=Dryococelus australis TaxID=614101 RepID=A0ABQ9FZF4_9NEOP|nr:hypothetical protein PR048_033148 [Dryococelus australis]
MPLRFLPPATPTSLLSSSLSIIKPRPHRTKLPSSLQLSQQAAWNFLFPTLPNFTQCVCTVASFLLFSGQKRRLKPKAPLTLADHQPGESVDYTTGFEHSMGIAVNHPGIRQNSWEYTCVHHYPGGTHQHTPRQGASEDTAVKAVYTSIPNIMCLLITPTYDRGQTSSPVLLLSLRESSNPKLHGQQKGTEEPAAGRPYRRAHSSETPVYNQQLPPSPRVLELSAYGIPHEGPLLTLEENKLRNTVDHLLYESRALLHDVLSVFVQRVWLQGKASEVSMDQSPSLDRIQVAQRRLTILLIQIHEKTSRPVASSNTIPTCRNLGVVQPGIEPAQIALVGEEQANRTDLRHFNIVSGSLDNLAVVPLFKLARSSKDHDHSLDGHGTRCLVEEVVVHLSCIQQNLPHHIIVPSLICSFPDIKNYKVYKYQIERTCLANSQWRLGHWWVRSEVRIEPQRNVAEFRLAQGFGDFSTGVVGPIQGLHFPRVFVGRANSRIIYFGGSATSSLFFLWFFHQKSSPDHWAFDLRYQYSSVQSQSCWAGTNPGARKSGLFDWRVLEMLCGTCWFRACPSIPDELAPSPCLRSMLWMDLFCESTEDTSQIRDIDTGSQSWSSVPRTNGTENRESGVSHAARHRLSANSALDTSSYRDASTPDAGRQLNYAQRATKQTHEAPPQLSANSALDTSSYRDASTPRRRKTTKLRPASHQENPVRVAFPMQRGTASVQTLPSTPAATETPPPPDAGRQLNYVQRATKQTHEAPPQCKLCPRHQQLPRCLHPRRRKTTKLRPASHQAKHTRHRLSANSALDTSSYRDASTPRRRKTTKLRPASHQANPVRVAFPMQRGTASVQTLPSTPAATETPPPPDAGRQLNYAQRATKQTHEAPPQCKLCPRHQQLPRASTPRRRKTTKLRPASHQANPVRVAFPMQRGTASVQTLPSTPAATETPPPPDAGRQLNYVREPPSKPSESGVSHAARHRLSSVQTLPSTPAATETPPPPDAGRQLNYVREATKQTQ